MRKNSVILRLRVTEQPFFSTFVPMRSGGMEFVMNCCSGEQLTVLSTVIALQMAKGLNADEVNILAAVVNAVANQLALIAAVQAGNNNSPSPTAATV